MLEIIKIKPAWLPGARPDDKAHGRVSSVAYAELVSRCRALCRLTPKPGGIRPYVLTYFGRPAGYVILQTDLHR